jgi:hypothetical protein
MMTKTSCTCLIVQEGGVAATDYSGGSPLAATAHVVSTGSSLKNVVIILVSDYTQRDTSILVCGESRRSE